jgi:hypothetical protein
MRIANIQCEVLVDQQALEEYQTIVDGHHATCHIAATPGQPYEIRVSCESTEGTRMTATLYIDGRASAAGCKWVDHVKPVVFSGLVTGDSLLPFQFAPLRPQQEDDDDTASATHDVSAVSTIRLDVWRVKCLDTYRYSAAAAHTSSALPAKLSVREQQIKKGGQMRDTLTRYVFLHNG